MRYWLYRHLWELWHSWLRWNVFGGHGYDCRARPWWHMCCNGNAGGWRTSVCRHLEERWRDIERKDWPA
jgi:hypothetical protein